MMNPKKTPTLKSELLAFRRECLQVEKSIRIKHSMFLNVPTILDYEEPLICNTSYPSGVSMSINFGFTNYELIRNGKDPDLQLLKDLLKTYEPTCLYKTVDSRNYTHFVPGDDDGPFKKDNNILELDEIFPIMAIGKSGAYGSSNDIMWYANIKNVIIKITVSFRKFKKNNMNSEKRYKDISYYYDKDISKDQQLVLDMV